MVERIYGVCLRHARRVLPGDPAAGIGQTQAEVAALRGITQGAAKTRMFRCREAYRGDD
jgi:hypothetical protein